MTHYGHIVPLNLSRTFRYRCLATESAASQPMTPIPAG
jgi:hypothetical protein